MKQLARLPLCLFLACASAKSIPGDDADDGPGADDNTDAAVADPDPEPDEAANDRRRAFLRFYAPIILKQSSESATRLGRDWITNFDFDNDQNLSNNKANWEQLQAFVTGGANSDWTIRPTLYSAMLEYTVDGRTDATLLYHVYHAKQEGSIHDWERVEIRINGLGGEPGENEIVRYVLVTEHSKHNSRLGDDGDVNFMTTAQGKHLLLWQAKETNAGSLRKAELHFVEESWADVAGLLSGNAPARVDINGTGEQNFGYAMVPIADEEAMEVWSARTITQGNALELAAATSAQVNMNDVKRVGYELQDIADIWPTHWQDGLGSRHWTGPTRAVLLSEPLSAGIDGGPAVPAGMQLFLAGSRDTEDATDERNGYASKHWMWGAYEIGGESFFSAALASGTPRGERAVANGDPASLGAYFDQHDYFAHDGQRQSNGPDGEIGQWLAKGWHTDAEGGFDGRWIQLFDNAADSGE